MSENAAVAEVLVKAREEYVAGYGDVIESDEAQEFVAALTQAIDVLSA
jgi:hypothetical protein